MSKFDFPPPPEHNYPVVIGPAHLRPIYGVMRWVDLLMAAKTGRDGLRVGNGQTVRDDVAPGECAWRELRSMTFGNITGLLLYRPIEERHVEEEVSRPRVARPIWGRDGTDRGTAE